MRQLHTFGAALALVLGSSQASALAMGPDQFAAARQLTCVLAQETLGYFSEDQYAEETESVLDGYDQAESDVIYAKAIGYYDGLMFGLPETEYGAVHARLQSFINSQACTRYTYHPVSL